MWEEGVTRQAGRQWSGVGSERVQRWLGGRCSGAGTPHHVAAAAGPGDAAAPADPAAPHLTSPQLQHSCTECTLSNTKNLKHQGT